MLFQKAYNGPYGDPEINNGKNIVETAGYISAKKRIENLMAAGHNLEKFRKANYDFENEKDVDPNFHDPTRDVGFDMADASQIAMGLNERQEEAVKKMKEEKEKNVEESKKDPEDPEPDSGRYYQDKAEEEVIKGS